MCGIAGSVGDGSPGAGADVESMVSAMDHRGPDARGTRRIGSCVLGHARLRVIDLSPAADQPMSNETATVWVVFNGEIYNYLELRQRLAASGHAFRSRSDTEVLVHLYEEDGPALVHALRGMFAFALWDAQQELLLLARDRLGIKPLYYRRSGRSLRFASETRALAARSSQVDPESVRSYLQLGWVPGPATIFSDVQELPPGHTLTWRAGEVDVRRYWSVPTPVEAASPEALAQALETSMRRQVVADVPVGLFLSSGVDSSVLAHLLARTGGEATAVTVGFEGVDGEEGDAARLAARLGIEHKVARTEGAEILRSLPSIVSSLDQPSVDGVNTWVVSQAVRREGIVVALSGLGGDELFSGYSTFQHVPRLMRVAGDHARLVQPAATVARRLLPYSQRLAHSRAARAFDVLARPTWTGAYGAVRGLLPAHDIDALLGGSAAGPAVPAAAPVADRDHVRLLELTNYLPFQLLRDTDSMSMAHALEVRVPLLDEDVVAAAGRLTKVDVAAAIDPTLLDTAARRKKTFTLPFDAWLRGPLRAAVGDAVLGLDRLGMDRRRLGVLLDAFRARRLDWRPIWALAVLGLWTEARVPASRGSSTRTGPILLLGDKWPTREAGGLNRYVDNLGHALRDQGVDARAALLGPAPGAPAWVTAEVPDEASLPARVIGIARSAARVGRAAQVLDAHFPLYGLLPALLPPLRGRTLVVHFHGPWALETREAGRRSKLGLPVRRSMERALQRRAGRIVTESAAFKQVLVEAYRASPWAVEVVAPGVDLGRFSPGRAAARVALGLAPHERVVLTVRRLESRMGLDLLVQAWAEVVRIHPDATLVIAGTGTLAGALQHLARDLHLGGSVRFLGAVDDDQLVDWYRAADFTVVPSVALKDPDSLPSPEQCRAYAETFSWEATATRHHSVFDAARRPCPTRLRVAFVDHCAELSGGELSLLELLRALRDVDSHTILATDGPLSGRLRRQSSSVEILPMRSEARAVRRGDVGRRLPVVTLLGTAAYVVRLAARLRRLRPDLVHTNSLKAAMYGGVAGRLAGVPVVWHVRDQLVDEEYPPLARRLVRALARTVPSGIVANSRSTLELIGERLPPAAVVPSIVVTPTAPPRHRPGPAADLRLGIVGRLAPWKGQHIFLKAFADAFPGGEHSAVIVGQALFHDDDYEAELRALAADLGLDGRVDFRGYRDDIRAELERLDVFVHASVTPEPFGRVIVEAMAAGLPVVASRAGGPLELVDHGRTGLLVTPGDVDAMSAAMRGLASAPEVRSRLGAAAYEATGRFTEQAVLDGVMGLYGQVLGRRGGRRRKR
jgi:asparagine synthase (glutamine-hydrolysing)